MSTYDISTLQFGDSYYSLHDAEVHKKITNSIQSISDFASKLATSLEVYKSFIDTTTMFMNDSIINTTLISNNEYEMNIKIIK